MTRSTLHSIQHGSSDRKTLSKLKFLKRQIFYEFLKNRAFWHMTTDFENRDKVSSWDKKKMRLFGRGPLGYTQQSKSSPFCNR